MEKQVEKSNSVIILGGTDSGKSNYIIRSWMAIDKKSGRLKGSKLPENIEYLRAGEETLLDGKFVTHTSHDFFNIDEIPITFEKEGINFESMIMIPDYPGEENGTINGKIYSILQGGVYYFCELILKIMFHPLIG